MEIKPEVFIIDIRGFHANEDKWWFLTLYSGLKVSEEDLKPVTRGTARKECGEWLAVHIMKKCSVKML
jgi:hypothetical protein